MAVLISAVQDGLVCLFLKNNQPFFVSVQLRYTITVTW